MKSTGIVRKLDQLGRIVIPKELRSMLNIEIKTPLAILIDGDQIVLEKYQPYKACMVTGESSDENLTLANGNIVLSKEGAEQIIKELQQQLESTASR
ncbi:AbrB/MazE/SpoVT family DNA-binding domain-containing protein [Shouchella clausii]|jgi:AbrB family transcriptional regulator, transcriptional pleiotropic regulator of transition state genes|uniref:Transcriptional pleiotropic regulator n=3 Tax=Shouchella TaxID=2893057 RepID=Q5WES6_SHOC1|nr:MULTISPECIES: AbrB/MazE/SpoVT family DNA-binding domain-containing protein [Shouchella]MCM3313329.1 AbrB/MazE/SpoVT family DNA-binding domain-containing protein [Psychrobacillus sp. MER TA 17]PAD43056.1 AbrB/MazE/SpoVT family DNA-binding domain-containing protein [Bacillus sp. 7520-S]SPU20856.1 transcriptional pleiotropic regulator [Niallia circulans]ALA54482.1 Transcription regulator AbrB [Shouchella clausii]AST97135.1 AbrB family transcriptional regulator [Shouchella clausii]